MYNHDSFIRTLLIPYWVRINTITGDFEEFPCESTPKAIRFRLQDRIQAFATRIGVMQDYTLYNLEISSFFWELEKIISQLEEYVVVQAMSQARRRDRERENQ